MQPPSDSITASIRIRNLEHAFSTRTGGSSANTRQIAAIRPALVLWEVMLVMFSGFRSWEEGAVRGGYKVVALLLKPSLGHFGLVGRRRVLLPHPGSATGHLIAPEDHHTQHIQVHFGVDFQADFEDVRWSDLALIWNHTKDHSCSRKLCFHHPGHVPMIRGNPDLHFEGAGSGPVVISWISKEHELYNGASPISLVELCVTFRHDRRLLLLLGFVHNWPTSIWSATKKENRFSINGNEIMSSFLGRQFYRSTCIVNMICKRKVCR